MEQYCTLPFVIATQYMNEVINVTKVKDISLMTRKETAEYLKVSLRTVDKIIHKKDFLGKVCIGRRVMVDKTILNEYIDTLYK